MTGVQTCALPILKLQRFFGGVNRQIGREEYERLLRSDLTAEKNDLNVDEEKREL